MEADVAELAVVTVVQLDPFKFKLSYFKHSVIWNLKPLLRICSSVIRFPS